MRKIIIAGLAALALVGGAADAQAFDWYDSKSKTFHEKVHSHSCDGPGYADVLPPSAARGVEIVSPVLGQQIHAEAFYFGESGPVQVTSVAGERVTMQSVGDWCSTEDDFDYGFETNYPNTWETGPVKFIYRYRIRKRLVMNRNLAKDLTQIALSRRYSWFSYADQGDYRCRISGNRGRCRHGFFLGDSAVIGVVKMRLVGRNGQKPLWSYRLKALEIDEYCRDVTPAGNCTIRTKTRRNRISLPYWVRAKTISRGP